MKKDVIISIVGLQRFENCEPEIMELTTGGVLEKKDNCWYLSYDESAMTGLEGTKTTFELRGSDAVTLSRAGAVSSEMIFEKGRKHLSLYDLGFGAVTIGVSTRRVSSEVSDGGGSIDVNYAIEIDHAIAGENTFQVKFRERKSTDIHLT